MTTITTADNGQAVLPTRQQLADQGAFAPPAAPSPQQLAAAAPVQEVQPVDLDALVLALQDRMQASRPAHPLSQFAGVQEWLQAARAGDPSALTAFAIAEQITSESPGVMANGWITDLKRLVDRGTRVINALGGRRPLPDQGMSIDYPYISETLTSVVGEQTTQLTDVTSVDIEILKGTGAIKTLAGGSTLSWQLINRSNPAYVAMYLRILLAAFAVVEDATFTDALEAGYGANIDVNLSTAATEAAIKDAIVEASLQIDDATGAPAQVILAGRGVFKNLAAKLVSPEYGTSNKEGVASAATLRVEVSGVPVVYAHALASSVAVVTNDIAAAWHGTGPLAASAEDVTRLGTDHVIWGMGASMLFVPAGVIKIEDVP